MTSVEWSVCASDDEWDGYNPENSELKFVY